MIEPATNTTRGDRREALRLLVQAARPERRHLVIGSLWLVLAAGLDALGPLLGKWLIDEHLVPRVGPMSTMISLLAGAWIAGMLASGLRYLQLIRLAGLAMRSVQRIRESAYVHVMGLPMAFFDRAITGQLVSRVTNDTEAVKQLYVQVLFVMLDSVILLGGLVVAMAWLDLRLTAVVALLLPAVLVIVVVYQRWSAPAVARAREMRSDINAQTAESIAGMAVLRASGATAAFSQRYAGLNDRQYQARRQELRANAWLLRPALDFLNVALLAGVIAVFGSRSAEAGGLGALEIGVLYAFVSYIVRVVDPLIQITTQFSQLQQAIVAAARVNVLLREAEAPRPVAGGRIASGALAFDAVSFGYLPGQTVLRAVGFDVPAGGFCGIVGATGSGKSTIVSLLLRFYRADAGRITLAGQPLQSWDEAELRRALALVPQDPFLIAASVRDNIDMGRGLRRERIEAAAQAAQATGFITRLDRGFDTPLGEGGARLAVGEKQLIAIARALAGDPQILLLDEATAHIDTETEIAVQRALTGLRGRVTVIAIAHRLSTIRDADQILVMSHGRIAERGTHDELMAMPRGIYQRLYELQRLEVVE
jgi:ATP-binding cassette, subfamily B, multidrug efflux pump